MLSMLDTLNDADFERFRKTIYDESGITFSATNRPILDSRIKEILREKKLDSVDDYYKFVTYICDNSVILNHLRSWGNETNAGCGNN